jgi:hypothetical protein
MRLIRRLDRGSYRAARVFAAGSMLLALAGCSRNKQLESEMEPRPDPIPVLVKNENFLDVNVFVIAGGVTRRLGLVSGNSSSQFTIAWSIANAAGVTLTAQPIGSNGRASSGSLNVSPGQIIEFKIGSVLRQSVATVRDPF